MNEPPIKTGFAGPGAYIPAGEDQGLTATFSAVQIANAFGVGIEHVIRAFAGEFGLLPGAQVDSRQAQDLAAVLLGELPQAGQEAALMKLGAFTPRPDHEWGVGEGALGEESNRMAADPDIPPDDLASRTGSHAASQPSE
ncbi:MAG: hypothetical protein IT337_03185 [Thermomicrobiales bacterium]|nr:hypothetical protein [Thermomicrobiales bacterium]